MRRRIAGFVASTTSRRLTSSLPIRYPLEATDAHGKPLRVGSAVILPSVASCAAGLPLENQARLNTMVGQRRRISRFDRAGFAWLGFIDGDDDFCLFPGELAPA
ncbi:hypothetical protein [Eleftheria terrae]|uniref:hypothetical protein n=1 Tax=Eleftheria terrae TaxID=1597781 RepID=UPI00263AF6E2|nr:hypothetical protein [Eleftheria terrae]WKB55824.1 hypothetical protein N7L95_27475 [Eleftheria terrae]